jgi:uncharacterized SAM-binding protein YcdF (DUF218 family)
MFFVLSKILGFFALPSNVLVSTGLLGVILLPTRFARAGRRLMMAALLLLAVFGFSPLGNALMFSLEDRFPAWDSSRGAPDGIIVLGGALAPYISAKRGTVALNESAERMTAAVALARRYPSARIVFSGGDSSLIMPSAVEAEFAMQFFTELGLVPDRVVMERESRNTVENAIFTRDIAAPKPGERWLLVTSGYHMPRAIGTFRRAGFDVEAYPVDWRTAGRDDVLRPFPQLSAGLARSDQAIREWVGLVAYWLTGKSSEFLPGPGR